MITSLQLRRVLIVDDNETAADFIEDQLLPVSDVVLRTKSSRDALQMVADLDIDIAFINYLQPECDGSMCARQMKELNPKTKTVIMANDSSVETDALLYWFIDYFIQKPFDRVALSELVSDLHRLN